MSTDESSKPTKELLSNGNKEGLFKKILNPEVIEFYLWDVAQVIVGATILAIPVGFTEEVWNLGSELPLTNILLFLLISIIFISSFVYYTYFTKRITTHWNYFLRRVFGTYILSFMVVAILLTLIQKAPWTTDLLLAFKRTVLVTFPASMSAAVADTLK
jgi:uncharacterized membrane protein